MEREELEKLKQRFKNAFIQPNIIREFVLSQNEIIEQQRKEIDDLKIKLNTIDFIQMAHDDLIKTLIGKNRED